MHYLVAVKGLLCLLLSEVVFFFPSLFFHNKLRVYVIRIVTHVVIGAVNHFLEKRVSCLESLEAGVTLVSVLSS